MIQWNVFKATDREQIADLALEVKEHLTADPEAYADPESHFDQLIEINLDKLMPHINGPFTPDLATPVNEMGQKAREQGWPMDVEWGLIGSCTNSSYEDLSRSASIVKQAVENKLTTKSEFGINPGSEQVRYTAERDGLLKTFEELGAQIFTNACGPCIGQWDRAGASKKEKNTIIHSFNRNFAKRNDGNPNTHAFVTSPEIVTAIALSGRLDFNPITDTLINQEGKEVKLEPPEGLELPPTGFDVKDNGYVEPPNDGIGIEVIINEKSDRIQRLTPFESWDEESSGLKFADQGFEKCNDHHISMAGPWLRYRGHLDNISNNSFIGAVNAFNGKTNFVKNQLTGQYDGVPLVQRAYKASGISTIVVGDHNYGEGSSREHAAMQPRHLGVKVVLVKSFARIHETNLKKQGLLALTFSDRRILFDLIEKTYLIF